jgi:VWFA-related protein
VGPGSPCYRSVVTPLATLLLLVAAPQEPTGPVVLEEAVSVERVMVDARVLDGGRAVQDLRPESFRVRIDDEAAELVSVTWISAEGARALSFRDPSEGEGPTIAPVRGRLIVLFFQKDLHPTRTGGLLRLLEESRRLVGRLGPEDRVAVLSFDTHLKLWCDFTRDARRLDRVLKHDVIFEERARYVEPSPDPSLAYHLSLEASRRAASPETALRLIGEALGEVKGSKTLVFLGYGLGELSGPTVAFHADYDDALRALLEADVTVFSLDVTNADRHTLEVGLQEVAAETGGFYARTHVFTRQAMNRLEQALEGHYVLEVAHPSGPRGRHQIDVDLVDRRGRVYARKAYFD